MAREIAHAIEAVAWAAGIYSAGANIIDRPRGAPLAQPVPAEAEPVHLGRLTYAA